MTHLDAEWLAQWAWDGTPPDTHATDHLRECERCAAELAELRETVRVARTLEPLEAPPGQVWERITVELQPSVAPQERKRRWPRRRTVLLATAAVAAGIVLGVLGSRVLWPTGSPADRVAEARLAPLEGKNGSGVADLLRTDTGLQLRLTADGLPTPTGFYEVWMINQDGRRMVSLGVLEPGGPATFAVPTGLTSQGYTIVDVSLEPFDGQPEHSRDSIIRGTLPN
ncbi:anti-sigma factor [Tenggerimyces flavus]|uniref:Anti-sigma factor domain-containing protein n=1 Tax=Tenggerimyces flavus TaxID=1708749 RepID=A0ABV7YJ83_9ACTN|nr:anti-sigma factor [Tenggerimyces flavus]MBM7784746.1 anti-sigma-K factor RskA [Tenggerimyces flavus]